MKEVMVQRLLRSNLRIRQLNMLILLERYGSVNRVAEAMGLTQPAVSKSLKEVEALVEVPLFLRESRGLRSTDLCKPLLSAAREALLILSGALTTMRDIQTGGNGQVSVGVVGNPALKTLAHTIQKLQAEHSNLRIKLNTADWNGHFSDLSDGKLDLVLDPVVTK